MSVSIGGRHRGEALHSQVAGAGPGMKLWGSWAGLWGPGWGSGLGAGVCGVGGPLGPGGRARGAGLGVGVCGMGGPLGSGGWVRGTRGGWALGGWALASEGADSGGAKLWMTYPRFKSGTQNGHLLHGEDFGYSTCSSFSSKPPLNPRIPPNPAHYE